MAKHSNGTLAMGSETTLSPRRRELLALSGQGIGIALIGLLICSVFACAWNGALALTEAEAAGEYVGRPTRIVAAPGYVGLILGIATGGVLWIVGMFAIARSTVEFCRVSNDSGHFLPGRSLRRPLGSVATHVLQGVRTSRGILPERLARALALVLPWVLIVALTLSTEPAMMLAAPVMAFVGTLLGRGLYAARPGARWGRPLMVAGIPAFLTVFLLLGALRPGHWTIPAALLVGAEIGAHLGEMRERVTSVSPRVLTREYAGVTSVGKKDGVRFDVRAFLHKPTRAELREFSQDHTKLAYTQDAVRVAAIGVVAALFPIGLLALMFGMVDEALQHDDDTPAQLLGMSAVFALMVLSGGMLVWWSTRARARLTRLRDHFTFTQFADQNGFEYLPAARASPDGADTLSRTMRARDLPTELLIANRESSGSNKLGDGRTHFGGVCAIEVRSPLPHIYVRSTRHRLSSWSSYAAPARGQQLSLEGDFDRYFEMSAPNGYETDALYLFTPDVMAWLVDDVQGFDVELRDRWVFLRSRRDLVTPDPADWQRLAEAMSAISSRIAQWDRWRDDRLLPSASGSRLAIDTHEVAAGGRRLRLGVGAGTIFTVLFVGAYLTLTGLANAL